ncbi:SusC/RagA family TonB-linked outer membrane protein [uncultured Polaribacter sp.]|uniref:SusC/RagA family TonB-linked outer membrane protein n=1 Tax=uncultured Polaribacter sp. TaxID=174711 RepID=UPI00262C1EA3|nr:SusC/RagA family TonB-linked outer membrane protein [uncultured Polaribacter sp.]
MEIKLTNALFFSIPLAIRKKLILLTMRTLLFLFCTTVFSFTPNNVLSQNAKIKIAADKVVTIDEVFELISEQTEYLFIYHEDLFQNFPEISLKKGIIRANKLLQQSLSTGDFHLVLTTNNTILIKKKTKNQQRQVSGTVTNEKGEVLPSVTILIKGTNKGLSTNFEGQYQITVPDAASVLVFSYLGYQTQEILVGSQRIINVTLKETASELDEVVINTGYYKVSQKEKTGSISRVTAKAIEQQPISNPLQAIQGRMTGVLITQNSGVPGGGINIQIRGQNSIRSSGNPNLPLYLVDGVPFSSQTLSSGQSGARIVGQANPLNAINPSDIESIEILKDADATAIYGSRGANGVVLITTKKGKSGKTSFDITINSGIATIPNRVELLNTPQYLEVRREALSNDGFDPDNFPAAFQPFVPDLYIWEDINRYTDWQDELLGGMAEQTNIQASVSGGNEQTQFRFSTGYFRETTIFSDDSNFKRASGSLSVNHTSANKKFTANVIVNYVYSLNNLPRVDLTQSALTLSPNAPRLYDDDGGINWEGGSFDENPLASLQQIYEAKSNNFISNANLGYRVAKNLKLQTSLGFNTNQLREFAANLSSSRNPFSGVTTGSAFPADRLVNTWIIEPQIIYTNRYGKHGLTAQVGFTFQETREEGKSFFLTEYNNDALLRNFAAGALVSSDITDSQYRYNAVFGRINYTYDDKYIINLTGRRDGSSRFGPNNRFGNFGAIGAAWVFSNEQFLKSSRILSFGKLRGSYGTTGNDQIGNYRFLDTYSNTTVGYNNSVGLEPTRIANPNFKWETVQKLEFGLELGFFKNRIFLETSYFRNRTKDQLIIQPLSGVTGFQNLQVNFPALIENRGFEANLNTINIKTDSFTWKSSFNITFPETELLEFDDIENSAFRFQYRVGEPLDIALAYNNIGMDPDTGLFQFEDVNEDGSITEEDRQTIIDTSRDFYGGFANTFSYKGIELDFLFDFVKRDQIRSFTAEYFPAGGV